MEIPLKKASKLFSTILQLEIKTKFQNTKPNRVS